LGFLNERLSAAEMIKVKTAFLDRDGVINHKRPEGNYVTCWEEFEFLPLVKEALWILNASGYRLIVVTNQRGIALKIMTESELQEIHKRMLAELAKVNVSIQAIYYCPHDEGQCYCRKPYPGMFLQAQRDFLDIDFESSIVIGDSLADIDAGNQLGCQTILISDALCKDTITRNVNVGQFA
jgi:histidinol-phosphate phosphatase family protein